MPQTTISTEVEAMMASLARSAGRSPEAYLATARATLVRILNEPDLLDPSRLVGRGPGLSRNLPELCVGGLRRGPPRVFEERERSVFE